MNYKPHPLAEIFPLMQGPDFVSFKQDIKEKGLLEPIWLFEGMILDGRHRFKACQEVGVEPIFRDYTGDDPRGFVISLNRERRHMDSSQRAMTAARLETVSYGGDRKSNQDENLHLETTRLEAAEMLNVSTRSVASAKKVINEGDESLVDAVQSGKVSVSVAADIAELPKEEQHEIVAMGEKEILQKAKEIRAAKAEIKKTKIREDLERIAANESIMPTGEFDVIVIDPPWPMEKIERDERPNQVGFDYPTMQEEELERLEIPAAKDCHVFLWTTHKFLPMAIRLLNGWGHKYVCTFVWHKPGGFQPIGLPQYNCEFVLYARKGSPSFIDTKAFPTCFTAPRGAHSEKPEEFYDLLRRVTGGRRLDMFNRRLIDGFSGWGNQAA